MPRTSALLALTFFVILTAAFAVAASSSARPLAIGTTIRLPDHVWIEVRNPAGIGNFKEGASCSTDGGAIAKVIGVFDQRYLVAYSSSNERKQSVISCEDGTLGLVDPLTLEQATQIHNAQMDKQRKIESERPLIEKLLKEFQQR